MKLAFLLLVLACCWSACAVDDLPKLRLFYPELLSESAFKKAGIAREMGVDVDQYVVVQEDTTFTYSYQGGEFLSIYWEFPCSSTTALEAVLEEKYQHLVCYHTIDSLEEGSLTVAGPSVDFIGFVAKNNKTNHIFRGTLDKPSGKVWVNYAVVRYFEFPR